LARKKTIWVRAAPTNRRLIATAARFNQVYGWRLKTTENHYIKKRITKSEAGRKHEKQASHQIDFQYGNFGEYSVQNRFDRKWDSHNTWGFNMI